MTNIFKTVMPKTILIHGPSGCGKDTQVDMLAEKLVLKKLVLEKCLGKLIEGNHPKGRKS
jgi:thymidylate kinase